MGLICFTHIQHKSGNIIKGLTPDFKIHIKLKIIIFWFKLIQNQSSL